MRRIRLSKSADADLKAIWDYTLGKFGDRQAENYEALLWRAMRDVAKNPNRPGTTRVDSDRRFMRYPIMLSRSGTGVRSPRHIVYFAVTSDEEILIVRILHVAMDQPRHLPNRLED